MLDDRIKSDLQAAFGLELQQIAPIDGGFMNKLYKAQSQAGEVIVKQFSLQRFSARKLEDIEHALQRQIMVRRMGVPCPRIYTYQGNVIRHIGAETAYMVMSVCEGQNRNWNTVTNEQMKSLGSVLAQLHKAFSALPQKNVKGYPIHGEKLLQTLHQHISNYNRPGISAKERGVMEKAAAIAAEITPDFLESLPQGIAHEDFTPDNVLFDEKGVTGIIDFDRNCYSFIQHDIGRALLSFALQENGLSSEKAQAFAQGYAQLGRGEIIHALKITWVLEMPWWIHPGKMAGITGKAARYRDEILWLTENWAQLDSLFL